MAGHWTWIVVAGLSIQAPPPECTVGPVPPYDVQYVDRAVIDALRPTAGIKPPRRLYSFLIHGDRNVVVIDRSLPPQFLEAVIVHEEAHLRGCSHG